MRPIALVAAATAACAAATFAWAAPPAAKAPQRAPLDYRGVVSALRLDAVVAGHLSALNGRYKMRASEVYVDPGGFIGPHQHVGPGLRYVLDGEVTLVEADGRTEVYRAGDFFFEPGHLTHRAENRGDVKLQLLQFELIPADFAGRGTTFGIAEAPAPAAAPR